MTPIPDFLKDPFGHRRRGDDRMRKALREQREEAEASNRRRLEEGAPDFSDLNSGPEYEGLPRVHDLGSTFSSYARMDDVYWNSSMREGDGQRQREERRDDSVRYHYRIESMGGFGVKSGESDENEDDGRPKLRAPGALNADEFAGKGKCKSKETIRESTPEEKNDRQHDSSSRSSLLRGGAAGKDKTAPVDFPLEHSTPTSTKSNLRCPQSLRPRTHISQPNLSARSTSFDSKAPLPTDQPLLIYHDDKGRRRRILPHSPEQAGRFLFQYSSNTPVAPQAKVSSPHTRSHAVREYHNRYVATPVPKRSPTPTPNLTWDTAPNCIVLSEADTVDPTIIQAVRKRARQSTRPNGDEMDRVVNAVDVGLVPNFSKPTQCAEWHERWVGSRLKLPSIVGFEKTPVSNRPSGSPKMFYVSEDEDAHEVISNADLYAPLTPNGVSPVDMNKHTLSNGVPSADSLPSSSPTSLSSYVSSQSSRPTLNHRFEPATTPEIEQYRLTCSLPSHTSSATRLRFYEETLVTHTKIIKYLHEQLDRHAGETAYLETQVLPQISHTWANGIQQIHDLEASLTALEDENEKLWLVVQHSRAVLKWQWERQWAQTDLIKQIQARKAYRTRAQRRFNFPDWTQQRRRRGSSTMDVSPNTSEPLPCIRNLSTAHSLSNGYVYSPTSPSCASSTAAPSSLRTRTTPPIRNPAEDSHVCSSHSTSSREELQQLLSVAEQNGKLLQQDVDDWGDKVADAEAAREVREGVFKRDEGSR